MQQLLLVDDDGILASLIVQRLADEWSVVHYAKPQDALLWLRFQRPDVVILDVELNAQIDGFALCRILRKGGWAGSFTYVPPEYPVPILMLTSRTVVEDRIRGLDEGADDYLPKPFDMRELRARLHALVRRLPQITSYQQRPDIIRVGELTIFPPPQRRVVNGTVPLELTDTEFDLLLWLAQHPNVWHSRDTLLREVWGYSTETRTVDAFVRRLRKKLTELKCECMIQTKYGAGYMLVS